MESFFLSIRWQVALSVSLILLLGFGLVTYLGQKNLEQTYLNQRNRVLHDRQQALTTSLNTLQRQLTNIANHMQGVAARTEESGELTGERLRSVLKTNWDDLDFEWGVDGLALFTQQGNAEYSLGTPLLEQLVPADWISQVADNEIPLTQIRCKQSCWQVIAVPVLMQEQGVAVLVLFQDLADVVLQFQSTTTADVGILVSQIEQEKYLDLRSITGWQKNVVALTGGRTSFEVLSTLSERVSLASLESKQALQEMASYHYEVSVLRLSESQAAADATLIVLENVTADLQRLNSTLSNLFGAAILIFLLAEAALFGLLSAPMARLRRISQLLPRLAGQHRRDVTPELKLSEQKPFISNEIHRLFDSAVMLSETLQRLDEDVEQRKQKLELKSSELLKERNFVTTLLNSVPVIILTQNRAGEIVQLNLEGSRLFDAASHSNETIYFTDFFQQEERAQIRKGLDSLFSRSSKNFHHESHIYGEDDIEYFIDWRHNQLSDPDNQELLVLSVGLDLTARKHAENNLAWLADHDSLTELFNRRRFHMEFELILRKASRSKRPGALIFFDIDQFKTINDTSGHPAGDKLLREVALKLQHCVRDIDVLARVGGDEFAILAADTVRDGAIALANKLCESMSNIETKINGVSHRITLSLGVVLFPEHGITVDELMANADLAMYKAKALDHSRNNWSLYSIDSPEKQWLHEQVDWKAKIQRALNEERLILYYQPIYDINADETRHYEALVRMVDIQGEIIPPFRFIPIAEKTGLIYDIDRYVIKRAIQDLKSFQQQGKDIKLSINLSATAITKLDFFAEVESLVSRYGVEQSSLIFELTETSAVEDVNATALVITKCRRLGYQFALDDFGVGFASWFYLRQLPVDYVKIDGSFVRDLATSSEDRLFVSAINNVAQGLGKKTVAEFVESQESLGFLKELGVDYAQGYYIGKPLPDLVDSHGEVCSPSKILPSSLPSQQ